jgi:hypothetical protein
MLSMLATTTTGQPGPLAIIVVLVAVVLITLGLEALLFWKVFEKAGVPGWWSIVPVMNQLGLCRVARIHWAFIFLFFGGAPGELAFYIIVAINIAKNFGRSGWFATGLCWPIPPLFLIFYPILGFGRSQYLPGIGLGIQDPLLQCSACGQQATSITTFCPTCGNRLGQPPVQTQALYPPE